MINYDIIINLKLYLFSHFPAANYSLIFSSCNNYSFYRVLFWGGKGVIDISYN